MHGGTKEDGEIRCTECEVVFKENKHMEQHIREKHEGIPYKYKPKNKQKEEVYDSDSN